MIIVQWLLCLVVQIMYPNTMHTVNIQGTSDKGGGWKTGRACYARQNHRNTKGEKGDRLSI